MQGEVWYPREHVNPLFHNEPNKPGNLFSWLGQDKGALKFFFIIIFIYYYFFKFYLNPVIGSHTVQCETLNTNNPFQVASMGLSQAQAFQPKCNAVV